MPFQAVGLGLIMLHVSEALLYALEQSPAYQGEKNGTLDIIAGHRGVDPGRSCPVQGQAGHQSQNRRLSVCVIGAASVDLAGHSESPVVMRDSNPGSLHVSWGGVGRNIAENLARLDVPVHLVTVLGDDIFSRQLQRHATDCGISMHARIVQDAVTPAYVCINDTNGELVVAVAAMKLLDQLDEGWVQENAQIIDGAGLCVIDANLGGELIGFMLTHKTVVHYRRYPASTPSAPRAPEMP